MVCLLYFAEMEHCMSCTQHFKAIFYNVFALYHKNNQKALIYIVLLSVFNGLVQKMGDLFAVFCVLIFLFSILNKRNNYRYDRKKLGDCRDVEIYDVVCKVYK